MQKKAKDRHRFQHSAAIKPVLPENHWAAWACQHKKNCMWIYVISCKLKLIFTCWISSLILDCSRLQVEYRFQVWTQTRNLSSDVWVVKPAGLSALNPLNKLCGDQILVISVEDAKIKAREVTVSMLKPQVDHVCCLDHPLLALNLIPRSSSRHFLM